MGIRSEIKAVIREFATCTIGANEAITAISNIVARPKPSKLIPKGAALAEEAIAAAAEHIHKKKV